MTKTMYIQPSVMVTEMQMIQTLCASGGAGAPPFSPMTPGATTDEQL